MVALLTKQIFKRGNGHELRKILAAQSDKTTWSHYKLLAAELRADYKSFLLFKEKKEYEEWLAGEESRGECWTVGRDWKPAAEQP